MEGLNANLAKRRLEHEASLVHTSPSDAQKEAGNYAKGHPKIHGMEISIETARGQKRTGTGSDGESWSVKMPHHYGYLRGTEGADGDQVDVYLGPHVKSPKVFVIDQLDADTGAFDEHKAFLGFANRRQAESAYRKSFSDDRAHERMGGVKEMSVDEFKQWTRDGDTKNPVATEIAPEGSNPVDSMATADGYASGGAVSGLPEGFVVDTASAPPSGFTVDQTNSPAPQTGGVEAFGRGVAKGVTANWGDEMAAATAASGLPAWTPQLFRTGVGAARVGIENLKGQPGPASEQYDKTLKEAREREELLHKEHPYWIGAGEVAGSVAGMAMLPGGGAVAQGTKFLPRVGQAIKSGAQIGAEYGALAGAGEGKGLGESLVGAGTGAVAGGVGGGAGGVLGEVIGAGGKAAYDQFGKPLAAIYRGLKNPEEEAMRRGAGAIMQGQQNVQAGKSLGMTPMEWIAAKQAGEPVMLADMGGETGRALLRSAANTDSEGRAVITSAVQDRFEGQGERAGNVIRGLVSGGADAFKRSEQLLDNYNKYRKPLYDAAYRQGDRPLWSPELERLASIPAVEGSIKSAVTTGANRAGAEGYGGFNPGVKVTPDGRLLFEKNAKGVPSYPNLQFWDYAYRDLRDKAGAAFRAGEKDHGSALSTLAEGMRKELDNLVPQYGVARGHAAKYFGGENALEAGANAVKFKGDARELSGIMAKIKDPRERTLFQEGYVSEMANRMENVPDRNDITKRIFQSPQDRKRIEAVLGVPRTKTLQSFLDRETIYDSLRGALGNSTTARQLIEAGLAGGGIGAYLGNGDPKAILAGIGTGLGGGSAGVAAGMRHSLSSAATAGAHKVVGYVDRNTARRVADFLTSDDPNKLLQGLAMVQKNPRLSAGMRDITDRVSIATGSGAAPGAIPQITVHPLPKMLTDGIQSPSSVGAEENQGQIPGPPGQ